MAISASNAFNANPCSDVTCQNFGVCVPNSIFNFTCQCNQLWTGQYCEKPSSLNYCFSSPCSQGSTCLIDVQFNTYYCVCQPGYTGNKCDVLIDVVSLFYVKIFLK